MAKVMAAVDLARVRLPLHGEGGRAEEDVEAEFRQQATQQPGAGWTAAHTFLPEPTPPLPQVSWASGAETKDTAPDYEIGSVGRTLVCSS